MLHIIHNPYANRGGSLLYLQAFIDLLENESVAYKTYSTNAPGHATQITKELISAGAKKIIALGGDGTLHEVVNGIKPSDDAVLGILPAGTGNDVATMLKIPRGVQNVRQAAKPILAENIKAIDCIKETSGTSKQSVLFYSYGIAAQMVMTMDSYATKTKSSYVKSILECAFKLKPNVYRYSIDDGSLQTVTADFLGMHNCIYGGGGMVLAHEAIIDDGFAEVFIVEHKGMARRVKNLTALASKKIHKQPNVKIIKAKKLKIHSADDSYCCIDGEILRTNILELEVIKNGIKIFRE